MLSDAGLQSVEATSFVSPRAVPQLADAAEVFQGICKHEGVRYPVLVPNMKVFSPPPQVMTAVWDKLTVACPLRLEGS